MRVSAALLDTPPQLSHYPAKPCGARQWMSTGGFRSLGLDQYEANFRDNSIGADVLPHLTADDLKELGVASIGDRRRLLVAIAALAGGTPPADVSASQLKSAPPKDLQVSAERRPITVMFCDLVGQPTSLRS